jgi:Zn-dependent peptidase ImmA (M78 family)
MPRPELEAQRLVANLGGVEPPIDVRRAAASLELDVIEDRMDRSISGLLYRGDEAVIIGVNANHPPRRQRFTVAHEIGHYLLHKGRAVVLDHVRMNFRDATSSTATDFEEIQANAFAAELLMPRDAVFAQAKRLSAPEDGTDATVVRDLADIFEVSEQAMEYRLINLGLRRQI